MDNCDNCSSNVNTAAIGSSTSSVAGDLPPQINYEMSVESVIPISQVATIVVVALISTLAILAGIGGLLYRKRGYWGCLNCPCCSGRTKKSPSRTPPVATHETYDLKQCVRVDNKGSNIGESNRQDLEEGKGGTTTINATLSNNLLSSSTYHPSRLTRVSEELCDYDIVPYLSDSSSRHSPSEGDTLAQDKRNPH